MKGNLYSSLRRISLLGICILFGAAMTFAQRTISGTVVDNTGEPLIGANILIKGTSSGTITDIDGNYTIRANDGDVLVFSYTGYQGQEITVSGQSTVNVTLVQGQLLDEIVVVGYGTVLKRDVTGSVASLKAENFNKGIFTSPDQLLQGRLAGVNVINNSGQPGGEATVKIRGNNSIRAGANPLYVVDGIPLDGRSARAGLISTDIGDIPNSNPLNFLNPSDIASIEVLKDASSAAIFGSRGANGVILVTTKKSLSDQPTIDFSVSAGVSSILKKYEVLNGDEYRSALQDYGNTGGNGGDNVDAFDEILRTGVTQNYNFSIGGGGDNNRYRLSFGYADIEGIVRESGIKKYNAALNSTFDFLDDRAGVDVFIVANHATEDIAPVSTNAGFTGNLVAQALQWNPTVPLYTNNGDFTSGMNNPLVGATTINPVALLAAHDERANTTTLLAGISPFVNITDKLQYRYRFGVNYGQGTTRGNIRGWINVQGIENRGFAAISHTDLVSQLHAHTLNFNTDLTSNLSFSALVGFEYQKFDFRGEAFAGRGFDVLDRDNTVNLQNGAPSDYLSFSFADPISELQSYFGRVNFNLKDKYLLTASIRADGSSKFGENNRYGYFPSFAVAWKLSNEDFISGGVFDDLKLRLGWGQTGNQEFPAGAAQERYQFTSGGVQQENVANPDLKWESSSTLNVGLDFALFDYALSGTIEYFSRNTDDLLLDPFVSEPGPAVRAWRNITGEVVNSGLEIALSAFLIEKSNVSLQLGANASFLNNEFSNFDGATIQVGELFGQGISDATVQVMTNGQPLNTFFTREFMGLDDAGNSIYRDNGDVFYVLGDPNADLILGATANLTVDKLSVGLNFNGAFGHQLYNNTANSVLPIGNLGTRNIDANLIGGEIRESTANAIAPSSRYIEDGDFIKLANATVSYEIGKVGSFNNINVSLTGQNLFVITDYTGFDPEVNTVNLANGIPSSGIEYVPYPSARSFLLSVAFSF
ncbi:MAG TPA: SusC/RagA family TonB-linked outer membrane protein [Saprospiraceae bacterium]|nr:SusC/RagA family TonB-linked outer membrane protein [Saprospiraceae bacterium]